MAASVLGEMAAPGAAIADAPDLSSRTVAVPLIDLRKVSRTYLTDGGVEVRALREVDLKIYPGEFVAIVGAVGIGQVHVDEYPRLPRPTERRPIPVCGARRSELRRRRSRVAAPRSVRLRVPELQLAGERDREGERRGARHLRGAFGSRARRPRRIAADDARAWASDSIIGRTSSRAASSSASPSRVRS